MHWRTEAEKLDLEALDIRDILDSADEEFALYNFLFVCRDHFKEGIGEPGWTPPQPILSFVSNCLRGAYDTDSEDIAVAAGVSFAEHLFDDASVEQFENIHRQVGEEFYDLCRPWLEKWLDPRDFTAVERAGIQ